ncbi:T9SS type A sorting domain-containing protein [Dyadobacter sediminis]|uniref:T9SS type A sorting domain-containing protein n=1 Tax=Dyadobacter sediminis TaxID=1493691 RepID=UPI0035B68758
MPFSTVQKHFTVKFSKQHSKDVSLEIISQLGRTYKINLPEHSRSGSKAEVNISDLSLTGGIYMLRIQSASLTEVIKVFVVD